MRAFQTFLARKWYEQIKHRFYSDTLVILLFIFNYCRDTQIYIAKENSIYFLYIGIPRQIFC